MAIGFNTTSSYGSRQIVPDKSMSTTNKPTLYLAEFGDGYEQRITNGLNPLDQKFKVNFKHRAKAEIDDIIAFFANNNGVTKFDFTYPDSNNSGETTIKVVCESWNQNWEYDEFYSASATFRKVYEP